MAFEYYEIRPCVQFKDHVTSYRAEDGDWDKSFDEAIAAMKHGGTRLFWTLYGVSEGLSQAIGDFDNKEAALDVLNAILSPLAQTRDLIQAMCGDWRGGLWGIGDAAGVQKLVKAASDLDDIINQSSSDQRI